MSLSTWAPIYTNTNLIPQKGKLSIGALLLCPLNRNLGRPGDQIRCSDPLLCSSHSDPSARLHVDRGEGFLC